MHVDSVLGGHAIMLKLEPTDDLKYFIKDWLKGHPSRTSKLDNCHLTLLFVGRDLPIERGNKMIEAAQKIQDKLFPSVTLEKKLAMFGGKRDHLAAIVEEPKGDLLFLHNILLKEMEMKKPAGGFGFRPHITLGIGPDKSAPMAWLMSREVPVVGIDVKIGSQLMVEVRKDSVSYVRR